MEINTDILQIGDQFYAVKRIEAQGLDIKTELKELYEARHKQHVETLNEGVVATAMEDWGKQIDHLRSFQSRGVHTIDRRDYNMPVMIYGDRYLKLRMIVYAPCEMKTNYGYIRDRQRAARDIEAIKAHVKFVPAHTNEGQDYDSFDNQSVIITFKPPFSVPLLVGYYEKTNTLYTPKPRSTGRGDRATYHTMGGGNVCTGSNSAADFWAMDDATLSREMNRINMFSPATDRVRVNGHEHLLRDLITPETFISIRNQGADTWSA